MYRYRYKYRYRWYRYRYRLAVLFKLFMIRDLLELGFLTI
jgi:hypothetical protein